MAIPHSNKMGLLAWSVPLPPRSSSSALCVVTVDLAGHLSGLAQPTSGPGLALLTSLRSLELGPRVSFGGDIALPALLSPLTIGSPFRPCRAAL